MKIVIVGPAHPLRGGIADFNEALCKSFIQAGHDCSIESFSFQYPSFLFPGTSQYTKEEAPADISIQSRIHSLNPFTWIKTSRAIVRQKPDLVIVRYWLPFLAPALGSICRLLRRKKIPVIAIADNILPHEKRPGDSLLTKYFAKSCDGFVAMSARVMEDLKKFSSKPARFLPHPIYDIFGGKIDKYEARKALGIDSSIRLILFFGFIRAYKGLDILLEAMGNDILLKQDIKLLIAGEFYEDRSKYEEIIKRNGIADSVILHTEFIPKQEVKNYFCAADLVVQPYRSATQSGITQIAYHFERPMLVTRVGGLSEIVADGKVGYVTEVDPGSVAYAINDFYLNDREAEFCNNLKEEKKRFSWSHMIQGILELYENIR